VTQAEQSYKKNPKALTQFQYCEETGIPLAVVLGQLEIESGIVKLRNIATREEVGALVVFVSLAGCSCNSVITF
jgi:histidyl-tRNA synthetase